jgi:hypothetical protein
MAPIPNLEQAPSNEFFQKHWKELYSFFLGGFSYSVLKKT